MAAFYTFEDLSGTAITKTSDNPYLDLIVACDNKPSKIQARYEAHRVNRNAQQREKLLAPDFAGVTVDEILAKLEDPSLDYTDWRNCLVFWARPPARIRAVIGHIQEKLKELLPNMWFMPSESLHMTALEITHSRTPQEIDALVDSLMSVAREIVDYTLQHRARLFKPLLSYDAQALALSFLPATDVVPNAADEYTYHHLRRDVFDAAQASGVRVASRYVIPSAHLTIARFITTRDLEGADGKPDPVRLKELMDCIDGLNEWLQRELWPLADGSVPHDGAWTVGEEKGLEFRCGTLWYGSGGKTVMLGQGW